MRTRTLIKLVQKRLERNQQQQQDSFYNNKSNLYKPFDWATLSNINRNTVDEKHCQLYIESSGKYLILPCHQLLTNVGELSYWERKKYWLIFRLESESNMNTDCGRSSSGQHWRLQQQVNVIWPGRLGGVEPPPPPPVTTEPVSALLCPPHLHSIRTLTLTLTLTVDRRS